MIAGDQETLQQRLTEAQRQRNELISRGAHHIIPPPLRRYCNDDDNDNSSGGRCGWRTTTKPHTLVRSAAADECVTLSVSPFPRRPPTIVFLPFDRPWDGDPSSSIHNNNNNSSCVYVEPSVLDWLPRPQRGELRRVPRDGSTYAALRFMMSSNAVRFSAVMCALERAGFTEETSLLSTSWCLKWCKRPVRSDFVRMKPFQRINHFPGTWRLGKKDELHKHLVAARERWNEETRRSRNTSGDNYDESGFGDFFPDGWVIPDEEDAFRHVLSLSKERGNLFIVKPTTSACGRGIYLLRAHGNSSSCSKHRSPQFITHPSRQSDVSNETHTRPNRFLVQRYITNPLLVEGYKFDLRLYVVVTSFYPLRVYLYDEGLVRFATSLYPTEDSLERKKEKEEGNDNIVSDDDSLTAHLTNFTINKKSEDFLPPDETMNPSKWTLYALQKHFNAHGLNWGGTMKRIHDLLVKTFLAVEPHVISEQDSINDSLRACCFEVYGVDVLLCRPQSSQENCVLKPILMEVNIMPSLSTHYSLLDQCVKGNFIADMLTLVGVTPAASANGLKKRSKVVPVSQMKDEDKLTFSYGHPFIDALTDATELESCMTAEEEFLRRGHFQRLCPTPESYTRYRPLFTPMKCGTPEQQQQQQQRSLNEVLSLWEQAKLDNPPTYNHR